METLKHFPQTLTTGRSTGPYFSGARFFKSLGEVQVYQYNSTGNKIFFYYIARSYLDAGIDASHLGQIELMAVNEPKQNYATWDSFLTYIRSIALT